MHRCNTIKCGQVKIIFRRVICIGTQREDNNGTTTVTVSTISFHQKKIQTQSVSTFKLCKTLSYEKAAHKMRMKLTSSKLFLRVTGNSFIFSNINLGFCNTGHFFFKLKVSKK